MKLAPAIVGALLITGTAGFAMAPLTPEEAAAVRRAGRNAPLHIQAEIVSARRTSGTGHSGCAKLRVIVRSIFKGKERVKTGSPLSFDLSCVFPIELSYPDLASRFARGRMIETILMPDPADARNLVSVPTFFMSVPSVSPEPKLRLDN
ncbi:hypothetical protein [Microvirga solisilvae]|uniref:hypothetical protein n=1 Tax=Microvirga solisilvae TaxID=2919498 RepID=UPI001FAE76F5|nr:hypothetical protein [Microvirga solisilvae]